MKKKARKRAKIKIKSIKQKAGGTVSYPEYIKVGNKFVKVKKPIRKNPVSTYIKVFRHGHGDKKFSQKGYFTGAGWNTEISKAKKYSAGEAKKLAMQLKIPDGWGLAIVSG